jgi:divalent metal cation (Fe/Co/Zn/Cd) transporter
MTEKPKPNNTSRFQYIAIFYNLVEALFAISFGLLAQSIALTGFGMDSATESLNDFIVVQRLNKLIGKSLPLTALGKPIVPVAILSFIFGSYVLIQALKVLILQTVPLPSLPGVMIAICSLIFMPVLAYWNYHKNHSTKTACKMGIKDIWAYMLLSLGLLLGMSLNYCFGFWQVDPLVGLITSGFLYKKSLDSIIGGGHGIDSATI